MSVTSTNSPGSPDLTWRKCLLPVDATLQDAIGCLNETGMQIVLITDPDDTLVGTLTDGDIRRALLRGMGLGDSVATAVKRDPLVVPPPVGVETVLQLMHANGFNAVPVVDERRRVVGLHILSRLLVPAQRSNLMVIMAGGRGTRLLPHTQECPKPLLRISGKPMLEHILERAKAQGFQRFVFTVYYKREMIEGYFGDGSRWQAQIDYLREQSPLGTAGAIGLLTPRPDAAFVVSNGDVLTDIHYAELLDFHVRNGAAATMAVRMHEWQHPFGVVRTEGIDIRGFEEKPISRSHINAGIYVLEPSALDALRAGEHCDMPTLFSRLQERGSRTIAYPMHEPWLDVGRAVDLEQARLTVPPPH